MELEVGTDDIMRDSYYEIADADDIDDDDATGCQNEKCGICMDIIIDRGVLDCCHHWFCFACIDNWATITNLCPLCQNEFQLITCVPVYDTIGTPKVDDEALSRDDDWFIRGTNNTLSFPSYYIDENAVICLDGDDCKIRSGVARSEDDSNLDTSIACDSCDKWYHAFCVRFDPESTSENSWLCPRCQFDEAPQKSDGALLHSPRNKIVSKTAGYECTTEGALSGKLSVSVVDTGETAVVVSMIEGKQWVEEASEDFQCEIHEAPQNLDGALPHFSRNNIGSETVGHERITDGALSGKLSVSVAGTGETADVVSMIEGNKWVEEASEDFQSEIDVAPQNSDGILLDSPKNKIGPETVGLERTTECVLSGKLSVSVADTRERAFTISTVEGMQMVEEVSGDFLSGLDIDKDGQSINGKNDIQPNVESKEILLQASFSEDMHATLSSDPLPLGELKTACPDKAVTVPSGSAHSKIPAGLLSTIPDTNTNTNTNIKPLEIKSNVDQHISLFVGSSLSVDNMSCEETENHISAMSQLHNSSKESSSSGNEMGNGEARICGAPQLQKPSKESSVQVDTMEADVEDATGYIGVKRKSTSSRVPVTRRDCTPLTENENDSIYAEETMVVEFCAKKAKAESNSQKPHVKHETRKGGTRELNCLPDDSELSDVQQKEDATSDIMSIVRGNYHRPSHVSVTPPDKPSKGRDKGSGLRVKKIMRRAAEDESSKVVENLRKEIKEAVRNKDVSKSKFFDPKLLAAFRTAVAGPKAEQEQLRRLNPSVVRAKKSMLMKGKARENLTKKIYGTTNGRRRRAWDREWEIEFWKHRCMRITQPEKVETLKSVLDLLRRGSKSSGMEQKLDAEGANPILSRLYLADTSVFPRKDDIKPLSDLTSRGTGEVNNERNLKEKVSQSKNDLGIACPPTHTKTVPRFSFSPSDKVERGDALDLKGETASTTAHSNCSTATKSSTSMLSGSKVDVQHMKEIPGKSDVKSDKRKWALEVLARKTAAVESRTQRKQEDPNLLNGNFPLLAQLPTDMRPVLAPSRHNKVSIPVRQTQLYRLTEHLLRKANLAVIRRTADTEFAVADAVNIEKDVVDRSNSKLVYVNLCSQVLAKHMNSNSTISATESNPSTERATTEPASDLSAEEALRMAGLMSDSPPSSPQTEHINDVKNSSIMAGEDVPDNVLDMDSHGDMDLEDEEYIGDNSLKISREQKLVFSTINKERADEKLEISKAPPDCLELEKGSDLECSAFEAREDASCLQVDPLQGKRDEQYSELYGLADKEARCGPDTTGVRCEFVDAGSTSVSSRLPTDHRSSGGDQNQEARANKTNESSDISRCVYKKVEAYIKEHIRPLCKSGVITVDQYRWAVGKTCEKIMKYHSKDKNANFLIKEGEKVKKLAEQYVEAAQKRLEES